MKIPTGIRILGIAGSIQTGKSELAPVFAECGWEFIDMNDHVCDLRARGTSRYDLYTSQFPGCLHDDGSKTGTFYETVSREFYRKRTLEDMELVVPLVREQCRKSSGPVALSWEYLPLIANQLDIEHTILFTSDYGVWMRRLKARLKSRGVPGEVTTQRIHRVVSLLDVWPGKIQAQVERELDGEFSMIDVSLDDWGASTLREWLLKAKQQ